VVIYLGRGADLHMAQLMPLPLTISCSSKSRLVLLSWYRLTRLVPDKQCAAFHTSSLSQYSMISVHRLLQAIVPKFCWLLLRLHESLYSMYGVPVSICEPMMWSHSFLAATTRRPRPSLSYLYHRHKQIGQCSLLSHGVHITIQSSGTVLFTILNGSKLWSVKAHIQTTAYLTISMLYEYVAFQQNHYRHTKLVMHT